MIPVNQPKKFEPPGLLCVNEPEPEHMPLLGQVDMPSVQEPTKHFLPLDSVNRQSATSAQNNEPEEESKEEESKQI